MAAGHLVFGPRLLGDLFLEQHVFLLADEVQELQEHRSGNQVLHDLGRHGLHLGAGQPSLLEELELLHALREEVAAALEVREHGVELALEVLVELLVVQLVKHSVDWVSRGYRPGTRRSL